MQEKAVEKKAGLPDIAIKDSILDLLPHLVKKLQPKVQKYEALVEKFEGVDLSESQTKLHTAH